MPTTEAHVRHTWVFRKRAFRCARCRFVVPPRIVEAAELRADMQGLPTDALLDRLARLHIKAPR